MYRSLLFVPAHKAFLYEKAALSQADIVILDLEDSVQPASQKEIAREVIKNNIDVLLGRNKRIYIRVNDRESGELFRDIVETISLGIEGYMYPKSESELDIYFIDKLIETFEYRFDKVVGAIRIIPLIETAASIIHLPEIAKISGRISGLAFGCEDYLSDIGGTHDCNEMALNHARAQIAIVCRANSIVGIDTVHIDVHDLIDLHENLKMAKAVGLEAMLCLHPKEIPIVHEYFTPSSIEVENALEVIRLSKEAEFAYNGVVIVGGKFIGPPLVKKAQNIVAKAKAYEILNEN